MTKTQRESEPSGAKAPRLDPHRDGRPRKLCRDFVGPLSLGSLLAFLCLPTAPLFAQSAAPEPAPEDAIKDPAPASAQEPATDAPEQPAPDNPSPAEPDPAQTEPPNIEAGLTQVPGQDSAPSQRPAPQNAPASLDPSIGGSEIRARVWASRYRPAHNPIRFGGVLRVGLYAGGKSKRTAAARGLAIEFEPGINLNFLSVSLALGAHMGAFRHLALRPEFHPEFGPLTWPDHPGYHTPFTGSTGLRFGIGRLALQGHGFIEPRLGYDVSMSTVKKINAYRPAKVAWGHGPVFRLDVGFLSQSAHRDHKMRRVFGASLGWNMIAGGLGIEMPSSHCVFVGIFAQMN